MNHSIQVGLDAPIWAALTSGHAHLGYGDALARRYHAEVVPFAAVASETPAAFHALSQLLQPGEQVGLLCKEPVNELDVPQAKNVGVIHQMVATRRDFADIDDRTVTRLTSADAKDMLDLAQRAKPGPFGTRTHETGNYVGVRENGRLVAMAGERMTFDGYVEISSVCVDDDWRGKGLAGRLMQLQLKEIAQRGATPFLHVFNSNEAAIALYERLGFELRRAFSVVQVAS